MYHLRELADPPLHPEYIVPNASPDLLFSSIPHSTLDFLLHRLTELEVNMDNKETVKTYEDTGRPVSSNEVDSEKNGLHNDDYVVDKVDHSDEASTDPRITQFTHAEQRKIVHRVDRRLTLTLGVMYCIR